MSKCILILQSNYIPWKGYFDCINKADEFIVYDIAQYTKNDWRNRNLIKTPNGLKWLTIPVHYRFSEKKAINEITVSNGGWPSHHWKFLRSNYRKAPFFNEVSDFLEPLYFQNHSSFISDINTSFIRGINAYLDIKTPILNACDFILPQDKSERLVEICKKRNGTEYLTGPTAKAYLNEKLFSQNQIDIKYFNYANYPPYPQLYGEFEDKVSILDLMFYKGKESGSYMKTFETKTTFL